VTLDLQRKSDAADTLRLLAKNQSGQSGWCTVDVFGSDPQSMGSEWTRQVSLHALLRVLDHFPRVLTAKIELPADEVLSVELQGEDYTARAFFSNLTD
jgi:hypothetical protein